LQGGGHSPLSHYFGLAADQVLDLTVVLASGEVVTANACQNSDLFTALRGGGGGTFGVVISATIKSYPTQPLITHTMGVVPLNDTSLSHIINITAGLLSKYSIMSDAGFAGYGLVGDSSMVHLDLPFVYGHTFTLLLSNGTGSTNNATIENAKSLVNTELVQDLLQYNGSEILLTSTWSSYPSFQDYYSGGESSWVGATNIMLSSRMFAKDSLVNNTKNLESMIHTAFTNQDGNTPSANGTIFLMNLVGGGKVLEPHPYTSMQPAWRKTYVLNEIITSWPADLNAQEVKALKEDVTIRRTDAMRKLTPGMGAYVNEALHDDPAWKEDFWGPNYDWLRSVKEKYDPEDVFWCWRCVGSEGWAEDAGDNQVLYGPLCQTS
jgi:Berberine and berberine like